MLIMSSPATLDSIRQSYLDFFASRDHVEIPSAPLVPDNDPTTLFTSSGMQPLVPYLLGETHPAGKRLVNSQKCFRSVDIEDVGDNRHTTYFEMLGNWSLGDYFKEKQLPWFFEFLTKKVGLDPQRLYVTVYIGNESLNIPRDEEAVSLWQELFKSVGIDAKAVEGAEQKGMQGGRIFYFGDKKNWWSRSGIPANMPAGEPGGPDSEVFFDFGEDLNLHENSEWRDQPCHVNCDCGRFMEIGNSVFMQYQKLPDGSFKELPQKNVDFGGGLIRILAAQNGQVDVFKTSAFTPIIAHIEEVTGQTYSGQPSFRVIADHVRAAVMLASDGVLPSNKEQGYFARRLLRRAIRHAHQLGLKKQFLADLVPVIAEMYSHQYPEVKAQSAQIAAAFKEEETKFETALRKGLRELEKATKITEETAFTLYETYGFPFEVTQEIVAEQGIQLSRDRFDQLKSEHASSSRQASGGKFKGGLADHSETTVKYHTATHLLHAALRKFLGEKVQQKGSNITAERLRFDFSFDRAMTEAEQQQVVDQVNEWIAAKLPVTKQIMPKTSALKSGAIAFFDNYPDEVSVYTIGVNPNGAAHDFESGWISKEFCGGPHVENTAEIGLVALTKEKSAAAGVRRVYLELV